jgi:ankyrin repeat protein
MYIDELSKLCREADFDREIALHYIKNTDINREFLRDNLSTVLLNEAIDVRNIPMIELLLENGASTDYCTPRIVRSFDKSDMGQYRFYFVPEGNGGYSGVIRDRNDLDTAYV